MRSRHGFPRNGQNSHQRAMYFQEQESRGEGVTRPTRTEELTVGSSSSVCDDVVRTDGAIRPLSEIIAVAGANLSGCCAQSLMYCL